MALACHCGARDASALIVVAGEQREVATSSAVQQVPIGFYLDLSDAASLSVRNFQLRVDLLGPNPGTDVRIASVSDAVPPAHPEGVNFTSSVEPSGTSAFGGTLSFYSSSGFPINDLATLMTVTLQVKPNVVGLYSLRILTGPNDTLLIDPDSPDPNNPQSYAFKPINGSLRAVPEPSSFFFVAIAAIGLVAGRYLKSRFLS
jgi:hypothetical protein